MDPEMTAGELAAIVRAAAPDSVRVGPYTVQWIADIPYEDWKTDER